jgi:catechol-2,3-dioxygenase
MAVDVDKLKRAAPPHGLPFRIGKLGHVVLQVKDLERSVDFYTRILGFQIRYDYFGGIISIEGFP